jgi:release factor glutamine methyltransferase
MNAVVSPLDRSSLRPKTAWTVLSLIEWSADHLAAQGFDEARLHVELLVAHVLNYSRLQLYTNFDKPLTTEELSRFKELFKRRLAHEPLQYIVGETYFMGLRFCVDSRVLIPRPETEELVDRTLAAIKSLGKENVAVLDIGTGSGNIAIALATLAPSARLTSLDVSADALAVARNNAELHVVDSISFVHADVFSDELPPEKFDIIVSNPPYISLREFSSLPPEVRDFEPRAATTDEGDGFRFIRRIAELAMQKLNREGFLLMELAYNQSTQAQTLLADAGLREIQVFDDYARIPRIISARRR